LFVDKIDCVKKKHFVKIVHIKGTRLCRRKQGSWIT
jgi:hypothetical protein